MVFYKNMKRLILLTLSLIALASCAQKDPNNSVPNIIFETDMGNDVDDALALDLLYKYVDAGKANLLAININKEGTAPAEFIDIMSTFYGYPNIPVGIINGGADCETDAINYAKAVVNMKAQDGSPLFKRSHSNYQNYPEAHTLYRKILAGMPDGSVTIVSVGFSTNLQRLLNTKADEYSPLSGYELVKQKVKLLCTMAGCFNGINPSEYNVWKDIPAAKEVFENWPSEIVTSPFELGNSILYPASSILNDFSWAEHHPMVEAYKAYLPMPYDRQTWDLTSVLYAINNSPEYFGTSAKGTIQVSESGATIFTETPSGNRSYMTTTSEQNSNILDIFTRIIPSKPKNWQ